MPNNRPSSVEAGSKRKVKRKAKNKLLIRLVIIGALGFAIVRFAIQQPILNNYDNQINELQNQIATEQEKTDHYNALTELYKTDKYKEQLARERLGLVGSDEKVFIDVSGQ